MGDEWICYYCGNVKGERMPSRVYARTSKDLINWSDYREVGWGGFAAGDRPANSECPFVVFVDGYYYLFRTSEYRPPARTHIYRSEDPFDFGRGNDSKLVTTLRLAAPEVVKLGEQYYISTVEDLKGGVQLVKLKWA